MPNPTGAYDPALAPWITVLASETTTAILQDGHDVLEGPLLDAHDWSDAFPDDLRRATDVQLDPARGFVDIVTVVPHPLMRIEGDQVSRTRFPTGSCLVRIDPDGSRRLLTYYDGPAYGWRNGRGFIDPVEPLGPWATWRGLSLAGAYVPGSDDEVELVAVGDTPPEGFAWARPGISRLVTPLSDVDDWRDASSTG